MSNKRIEQLDKAAERIEQQMGRYFDGEVTADATAQLAYAGGQLAFIASVEHMLKKTKDK